MGINGSCFYRWITHDEHAPTLLPELPRLNQTRQLRFSAGLGRSKSGIFIFKAQYKNLADGDMFPMPGEDFLFEE
jgi:hypothetical protein